MDDSAPALDVASVAKRRARAPKRAAEPSVLLAPRAGEPAPVVIAPAAAVPQPAPEPEPTTEAVAADAPVAEAVAPEAPATDAGHAETPVPEAAPVPAPAADPLFIPPAAVPAVHAVEETTMDPVNTTANVAQDTADKGRALFADWNNRARDAMERSTKAFETLGDFYKGNLEAFVESSRIAAKGFESFGQHAAEVTRKSVEDATAATKTLAQTKSPTEFLKLQGDYARSTFDLMVAETSRSTEAMLKLAGDVAQPVANRLAVAADKMKVA